MKTLAGTSAVVMIARSLAAASASRDAFGRVDPASANSDRSGPCQVAGNLPPHVMAPTKSAIRSEISDRFRIF